MRTAGHRKPETIPRAWTWIRFTRRSSPKIIPASAAVLAGSSG
ncbi:hypothetical protein [Lysobacter gummosus]